MDKLKYYLIIFACLLITVTGIIQNIPIIELSLQLIIAIILFYIIGSILENYLRKNIFFSDNIDDTEALVKEHEEEN